MILVKCQPVNDRADVEWPERLSVRPHVGDYIISKCGQHERKISRITHFIRPAALGTLTPANIEESVLQLTLVW